MQIFAKPGTKGEKLELTTPTALKPTNGLVKSDSNDIESEFDSWYQDAVQNPPVVEPKPDQSAKVTFSDTVVNINDGSVSPLNTEPSLIREQKFVRMYRYP